MNDRTILDLAVECRVLAAKIEREFGNGRVSRSETWRDGSLLLGSAKRLKNRLNEWYDAMSKTPRG